MHNIGFMYYIEFGVWDLGTRLIILLISVGQMNFEHTGPLHRVHLLKRDGEIENNAKLGGATD